MTRYRIRDLAVRLFCWITGKTPVIRCTICGKTLFTEQAAVQHVFSEHPEIGKEYEKPNANA